MKSDWKEVIAEWQGERSFLGKTDIGGTVQMGAVEGIPGASPMELLLLGVAGCTGIDVALILEKKRQPLQDLKVRVRGRRADEFPKVYTEIEIEYLLWGEGLSKKAVEQAIQLSEDKYCSASAMMSKTATITSSYRILSSEEEA